MKKLLLLLLLSIISIICISQMSKDRRDKNQKYLDNYTATNKILSNDVILQEKIIQILNSKEHCYRVIYGDSVRVFNESYPAANPLSKYQNQIIYLMLINLRDTSFCNTIGKIIKCDVENIYSECGGIVLFTTHNKIYLKCIKSLMENLYDEDFNDSYYLPEKEDTLPKIAYFHLHATTYNEDLYAGPSLLDLLHSLFILPNNMTNEFVITSIEKGKFNIDYYGIDMRFGEIKVSRGVKIVDLGVYTYK